MKNEETETQIIEVRAGEVESMKLKNGDIVPVGKHLNVVGTDDLRSTYAWLIASYLSAIALGVLIGWGVL